MPFGGRGLLVFDSDRTRLAYTAPQSDVALMSAVGKRCRRDSVYVDEERQKHQRCFGRDAATTLCPLHWQKTKLSTRSTTNAAQTKYAINHAHNWLVCLSLGSPNSVAASTDVLSQTRLSAAGKPRSVLKK
jgi:hypothetical protein